MNVNSEAIRQHQAYKAARQRIFMAGRQEEVKIALPSPEPITIPVAKPPAVKLVWVRQYNEHVIAYRRWQLAQERGKEYMPEPPKPDVHEIIMAVLADHPGVTLADIKGPRRANRIVLPRQIAMYEVHKQRPDLSYPQIGRLFGGRDHSTCLHAIRKMEKIYGKARG
jgi:hypothetical protein